MCETCSCLCMCAFVCTCTSGHAISSPSLHHPRRDTRHFWDPCLCIFVWGEHVLLGGAFSPNFYGRPRMRKTYFAVREMEKEEKRACMHAHICRHMCVYTGMYTNLPMFLTHTEKHNFLYHVCIHEWNEYTQGGKEFGLRSF